MADKARYVAMPNGGFQRIAPLAERFWSKVSKAGPDECWLWQGHITPKGYGLVRVGSNMRGAHQVSLELAGHLRPLAPNNHALHGDTCVARSCVNPAHLRWGSNRDNTDDRERLGRNKVPHSFGEKHGAAKLNDEKVRAIRAATGRQKDIGASFGVSQMTVSLIKRGKHWGHVQ